VTQEKDERWVVVVCSIGQEHKVAIANICLMATSHADALQQVKDGWKDKIVAAYAITAEEYAAEAIRFRDETDQPWNRMSNN
jgi:hypothetical protein